MGRSQETFQKKEVRNRKERKRKEKEKKRLARKEGVKRSGLDDMIAYVDENGMITSTPPDPNRKKKDIKLEDIEIGVEKRNTDSSDEVSHTGIVKFFNEEKGYGFIKDMNTQISIFVHANNLEEPIKENNKVSFEIEKGIKGLTAVKVKLLS